MTSAPSLTVQVIIHQLADEFSRAGVVTARLDARLLVQAVTGLDHAEVIAHHDTLVSAEQMSLIRSMADRRLNNEPVSRIVGTREFFGREFFINSDVLDPRPDTETLIEQSLACVALLQADPNQPLRIADLGTGSGAIAVTLCCENQNIEMVGIDVSVAALAVAEKNARRHNVEGRLDLIASDWFENISGNFDLIVSNPPYIDKAGMSGLAREVLNHDPLRALDGGPDGLEAYRKIAESASTHLHSGAFIVLETGFDQAKPVLDIFLQNGFVTHDQVAPVTRDLAGNDRVITLMWQ